MVSEAFVHLCMAHKAQRLIAEQLGAAISGKVMGCRCTVARVYPHPVFGYLVEHDEHSHGPRWGWNKTVAIERARQLCRPGLV